MIPQKIICVDIGSTYTKGAVFNLTEDRFKVGARAVVPTTVNYLPDGFYKVLEALIPGFGSEQPYDKTDFPVFFSSSAKGGLKIAVVGLVPEMSLNIARLAAFSAGAKVCAAFPYRLGKSNIAQIESLAPDILLFCGGTDGGNERYALENSKMLAASKFSGTIIYAGNNFVADEVANTLSDKEIVVTENVMPDFGKLNIEPVREAIRKVFLEKIISGKGLNEIVKKFEALPVPTPLAVFNLAKAIGENVKNWNNFAIIDMGGATTDFYSYTDAFHYDGETVMKGIVEPLLKRTVEGDLGMRVSAESACETGTDYFASLGFDENKLNDLKTYSLKISESPEYLPENETEKMFDRTLAGACIYHSLLRHAGTIEEVFTIKGRIWAQTGKDLRRINKIIGTGGYLAAMGRNNEKIIIPSEPSTPCEKIPLLPQKFTYHADNTYVLPLLANLAEKYPKHCAVTAIDSLDNEQQK